MLHSSRLQQAASLLLLIMALSSFLHVMIPTLPLWLSGVSTWLALGLLLMHLPWKPFKQFFMLTFAGIPLLWIGWWHGANLNWHDIVLQNNGLISLLYGVGFLRLITLATQDENRELPQGRPAFLQTLFGVHVLGAVINMSILVLMAERLHLHNALSKKAVIVLNRGFSMAAFWSPFFAAMAVALTYAPQASLSSVVITGLVLTGLAMLITLVELGGYKLDAVENFRGYPVHLSSLIIPSLLAVAVLVLHYALPTIPVLTIISISAMVLSIGFVIYRQPLQAVTIINTHVFTSAQRMARELSLFMGAGVLSIGVQVLFSTLHEWHPLNSFGGWQASLVLAIAIVVSIIGVHPVVSIAVIGTLVQPLHPDPTVLAIVCLSIWSLGVVASPFSGVNTVLSSQFQVKALDLLSGNIGYVMIMWLCISALFFLLLGKG